MRHRRRHLAGCLTVVAGCVGVVLLVLTVGADTDAAPALPAVVTADGAPGCLGAEVAPVQTGVFVDLHVVPDVHRPGADVDSPRLARGRIDLDDDVLTLEGRCAPGTTDAGRPFRGRVQVLETASDSGQIAIEGTLHVDDAGRQAVRMADTGPGETVTGTAPSERRALEGSALVSRTFLAIAVVVIAARLAGAVCARIGQPPVIGEILAGIALGPSLLGAVQPDVTGYLFPTEVTGALGVLAQLGLALFMFLVGLELDLPAVRATGPLALAVSQVSVAVPFALGAVLALAVFPLVATGDVTTFALFVGVTMAITALPVLARILADLGLAHTRVATVAITCAAATDVTAWCVLSLVVARSRSGGALDALTTVGLSAVFVVVVVVVVRPLLARLLCPGADGPALAGGSAPAQVAHGPRRADSTDGAHGSNGSSRLVSPPVHARGRTPRDPARRATGVLLATVLLAAWATEAIGIHAIFGAFLIGAIAPRRAEVVTAVRDHLQHLTNLVLLPAFFMVVGLSTRIGLLDRPAMWALTALVIVVAVAGRWGATTLAVRTGGMPWREASAVGVLMNARGLTEIVVLTIGRELGIVSPGLFSAMVAMALVTTVMATPVTARLMASASGPRARLDVRAAPHERLVSDAVSASHPGAPSRGASPHSREPANREEPPWS